MGALEGVPLLLAAAEVSVRNAEDSFSRISQLMDGETGGQTAFVNGLRVATVELEIVVVGVFSLFEARMQDHLPKGNFFKLLRQRLIEEDQPELAGRIYRYYLVVNAPKSWFSVYGVTLSTPT